VTSRTRWTKKRSRTRRRLPKKCASKAARAASSVEVAANAR
jgi:hypothetical protein